LLWENGTIRKKTVSHISRSELENYKSNSIEQTLKLYLKKAELEVFYTILFNFKNRRISAMDSIISYIQIRISSQTAAYLAIQP
jgi:hypothetical protein